MARRRVIGDDTGVGAMNSEPTEQQKVEFRAAAVRATAFASEVASRNGTKSDEDRDRGAWRDDGDPRETVTVTWGEEIFTPRQYHSFRVGPFSGTTVVREGETRVDAGRRLRRELKALAEEDRLDKHRSYLDAVASVSGGKS